MTQNHGGLINSGTFFNGPSSNPFGSLPANTRHACERKECTHPFGHGAGPVEPDTAERRARLKGDVHPKNMNERNKGTNVSTDTWPYLFLLEGHFKIIGGTCKYGRTVCACRGQGHPSVERKTNKSKNAYTSKQQDNTMQAGSPACG